MSTRRVIKKINSGVSHQKNIKVFSGEHEGLNDFIYSQLPEKGFCIEIGANNGEKGSHCHTLILKGWEGIAVEADPRTYQLLEKFYLNNKLNMKTYNYAICKEDGEKIFYSHDYWCSGLSSLFYNHATGLADPGHQLKRKVSEYTVKSRTLETLLKENDNPKVDYLQIDTEGADAEIILSTDFSKITPKIIYAETNKLYYYLGNDPKLCPEVWELVKKHMEKYNYSLISVIKNEEYKQTYCPDIGDIPLGAVWKYYPN